MLQEQLEDKWTHDLDGQRSDRGRRQRATKRTKRRTNEARRSGQSRVEDGLDDMREEHDANEQTLQAGDGCPIPRESVLAGIHAHWK